FGCKARVHKKESDALLLLRINWKDIAKRLKTEIDSILRGPPDSIKLDNKNIIKQDSKPVSGKGDQLALQLQKLIYEHVANMHQETQKITKTIRKEDKAPRLQKFIVENIEKMKKETHKIIRGLAAKETHSSRVNDENQSIFHIAAINRHEGIYNLLYEIGAIKDLITPLKDQHDNNMLHLIGMIVNTKGLEDVSITALHMQRELLWFKEVESMIPPSYRKRRNSDGLTPHELFRNKHKDMVTQSERWMKEIASQCIVVGALVATMVFAVAFTVPGGYDENGIPIFHSKTAFKVFVVADGLSLFLSLASVLNMFLSLFTSSYTQKDFLEILPRKLMVGLSYLHLSIITMLIAIAVNFFVLYQKDLLWMPIL
nr:hypothetical protein [Tanacetum cinerariifolium]